MYISAGLEGGGEEGERGPHHPAPCGRKGRLFAGVTGRLFHAIPLQWDKVTNR